MGYEPIAILAFTILSIVLAVRGLVNSQGKTMSNLIDTVRSLAESTAKNAENVNQLEVLYRETLTDVGRGVGGIEQHLIRIEHLIREAIKDCKNGNTDE